MARVVAARAVHPEHINMFVICVCGFPQSHPCRNMKEEMLIDVIASMATLTVPTIMGGDLNTVHDESPAMVLAEALGKECVSPREKPTTKSRDGGLSTLKPIDHVFANYQAMDMVQASRVNYAVALSDYYPIEIKLRVPKSVFTKVRRPRKITLLWTNKASHTFPWLPECVEFSAWQRLATRWLSATYGT